MSYEKVKILGIREVVKKQTGQVHHFLQVELLQSHDLYLNDDAIKQLPLFEALKGQECLLPVSWGEYQGKPSLNIADDFRPLPMAAPVVPAPPAQAQAAPEPQKTEQVTGQATEAAAAPLFNRRNGNNAST